MLAHMASSTRPRAADELPQLDEHTVAIAAAPGDVWAGLLETIDRSFGGPAVRGYARLVGCADCTRSGPRPLDAGSTVAGFRVRAADPGRELVLEGRHRFSDYALIFRIDSHEAGRSTLQAESRATFPGRLGALYRLVVIGSRGHAVLTGRLLATVRRRSEQLAGAKP